MRSVKLFRQFLEHGTPVNSAAPRARARRRGAIHHVTSQAAEAGFLVFQTFELNLFRSNLFAQIQKQRSRLLLDAPESRSRSFGVASTRHSSVSFSVDAKVYNLKLHKLHRTYNQIDILAKEVESMVR